MWLALCQEHCRCAKNGNLLYLNFPFLLPILPTDHYSVVKSLSDNSVAANPWALSWSGLPPRIQLYMSRRSLRFGLAGKHFSSMAAGGKDRLGPVPWVNVSLNWRCASIIRIDSLINLLILTGIGFTLFLQKYVMCLLFHHFVICSILDSRCPLSYALKDSLFSKSTAVGKWSFKQCLIS